MKKKISSLVLVFLMVVSLVPNNATPALAASEADYEAVYQWNKTIYDSRSTNAEALDYYLQPQSGLYALVTDDPQIVSLTQEITSGKTTDHEKAKAIHDWVANNIWYDYDFADGKTSDLEEIIANGSGRAAILSMLDHKRGVCSWYALLTVSLLRAAGIPAGKVSGIAEDGKGANIFNTILPNGDDANHDWVEAYVDGRWIIMDTTWDSNNSYRNGTYSPQRPCDEEYFDISLRDFSRDHRLAVRYEQCVTEIIIPNGATIIGDDTFISCERLMSVTIPNGVASIGIRAFYRCSSLQEIALPNGVTEIGSLAFAGCSSLTGVIMPNTITKIESETFRECASLTNITIPDGVITIGGGAFYDCSNLTSVIVPVSVTNIGTTTFQNCSPNLTIYGKAGSYAETYAKANNIKFSTGTPYDSASDWARTGIVSAVSKGFVPADLQNNYKNIITRQEFCRMAVKFVEYKTGKTIDAVLADKGLSRNPNAFSDTVDPDIQAAYALGITSGTKAPNGTIPGTFTPDGQFSREQAATMIRSVCRVIGMDISVVADQGYTDIKSASAWAVDGINFCYANGIMTGTSTSPLQFSPKATYTREQSIITFNNIK